MNYQLLTLRTMKANRWSRAFSMEYVLQRHQEGLSHSRAYAKAMASPYIRLTEKPMK
jgi:hypothetical protein